MIEIGIHLVDPITFMDDVKSAITLANTHKRIGRFIVSQGHGGGGNDESVTI